MASALVLAVVGILLGPFLGIAVDRLVEREKIEPQHRCVKCQTDLGLASLIPVHSWLVRCPADNAHANWRYPVTDLATSVLFALAGWRFGLSWQLWPYVALFAVFVVMSLIDWEQHLLIDLLTLPTLGASLFAVLVLSGMNNFNEGIWPAIVGSVVYSVVFFVAHLANPAGMGLGDVKLAPTLGLALGWLTVDVLEGVRVVFYAMMIGLLLGGVVGLVMRSRAKRRPAEELAELPEDWIPGEVPLGPFLIIGTVIMIAVTSPASLA